MDVGFYILIGLGLLGLLVIIGLIYLAIFIFGLKTGAI